MFGGAAPAGPDMPAGVNADDLAALRDGMQQLAQRVEQGMWRHLVFETSEPCTIQFRCAKVQGISSW